ncbi:hypothetical protein A2U01_0064227, partial [Trifolium medium]|nr:hypothetical protein [Trifolium medium]
SLLQWRIEGGGSASAAPCSSTPVRVRAVLPSWSGSSVVSVSGVHLVPYGLVQVCSVSFGFPFPPVWLFAFVLAGVSVCGVVGWWSYCVWWLVFVSVTG